MKILFTVEIGHYLSHGCAALAPDMGALNRSTACERLTQPTRPRGVSDDASEPEAAPSRGGRREAETGAPRRPSDNTRLDSSPETSAFRALRAVRAVRISPRVPRLPINSCSASSGIVNQRRFGARGLSMRGETIRERARDSRPGTRRCCRQATRCRRRSSLRGERSAAFQSRTSQT